VNPLIRRVVLILLSLGAFVIVWKLVVVAGGYPDYILPPPELVFHRAIAAVQNGTLQPHLAATLEAAVIGFAAGAVVAIGVGILLAKSLTAERVLSPYLVAAQAIPILALAPLVDIWFGSGLAARVVICGLIVFFPIAIATIVGIRATDPLLVEMARANGARPTQITSLLELPSALPVLFGGLRVGVTLAVVGAVVAEWAGASIGLGVLINIADQGLFDTPLMFVALASLAVLGLTFYGLVLVAERLLIPR
jgi:putative riboflavin transport system permease protein